MAYQVVEYPAEKSAFYERLLEQIVRYTTDAPTPTAALAIASAVLAAALHDINWAGFYLVHNSQLVLEPVE